MKIKKYLLLAITLLVVLFVTKAQDEYIKFNIKDGSEIKYEVSEINEISFTSDSLIVETIEYRDAYYTFSGSPFGPGDNRRDVIMSYRRSTPNVQTYTIIDFLGNEYPDYGPFPNIDILVPDASNISDGRIPARIKPQPTGMSNSTGEVWIADMASFYVDFMGNPQGEGAYGADSYYEPSKEQFTLHVCYFLPSTYDAANGNLSWFGDSYEYLELPGHPHYGVEIAKGSAISHDDGSFAVKATITPEREVAFVRTIIVAGSDENIGLQAITSNAEGLQEFIGNRAFTAEFPVSEEGTYTIVAQTYNRSMAPVEHASTTFDFKKPEGHNSTYIGEAIYLDGFLGPRFSNPVNVDFSVGLYRDNENPNIYYLKSPYTQEGFSLNIINEDHSTTFVKFDVSDPTFVLFPQQYSGFTNNQYYGGEVEIGNLEGVVAAQNPGLSYETIKNALATDEQDPITEFSSFENGVVYICNCMFSNNGQFGYQLKSNPVGIIQFPQAKAAAKDKAIARNVTRPAFDGMFKIASREVLKIKSDMVLPKKVSNTKSGKLTINTKPTTLNAKAFLRK